MKVAKLETLFCDAGWRPWIFLKATADDGAVGWAEITDSHGSPRGLAGIVEDSRRWSSAATRAPSRRSTGISTARRARAPAA